MDDIDYVGDGYKMEAGVYSLLNEELKMENMDYWRLCDELSVLQAALLVIGEDPSKDSAYAENWHLHERPAGYEAAKTAITNALRKGTIEGKIIPFYDTDINGNVCGEIPDSLDVKESRVGVESLRTWLRSRGIQSGFFFPTATDTPDYLNRTHPRYAPKLAAAIQAWLELLE